MELSPYLGQLSPSQLQDLLSELKDGWRVKVLNRIIADIETNAAWGIGIAEAEGVPRTQGRLGTFSHQTFEYLNGLLTKLGTGFRVEAEFFVDEKGKQTTRRAPGSVGVDAMIFFRGERFLGVDLKSGRGWSPADKAELEKRFKAPLIQIGPKVSP